ncbi:MAG TPA: hypothetical protein VGN72_06485 [Tepidisphaeraceae bacterium]|nr:hypothetical protein [Tepidisphaeraceae bacterium]
MIRTIAPLSIALLIGAVGCGSGGSGKVYQPKTKDTALAAYAGNVQYPTDMQATEDASVTATVNKQNGRITIRNFSNKAIIEPRVWVNQVYVLRTRTLSPQDTIVLDKGDLYDSAGRSLRDQSPNAINTIHLQTDRTLVKAKGPLFE